jgi:hypothetical protein
MLILKIIEDEPLVRKRKVFKKRREVKPITRERVVLNGKLFYIAEIQRSQLSEESACRLFGAFKGRIVVADDFSASIDKSYLFQPYEYYQRAFISALIFKVEAEKTSDRNVFLRLKSFKKCDEIFELIRVSKKLVVCAESFYDFDEVCNFCFERYGAVVYKADSSKDNESLCFNCDLSGCDIQMNATFYFKGKRELLDIDRSYFKENSDVKFLENLGISREVAAAVIYA